MSTVIARAILAALKELQPSQAQPVRERVQWNTNGSVKISFGGIYPLMRELEDDGLVTSFEGDATMARGWRRPRFYELTAGGLRKLHGEPRGDADGFRDPSTVTS